MSDEEILEYEIIEDTPEISTLVYKLKVEEAPKPPQMIMFDRYFMSLGKPMHHKAGMLAFCSTKGKKTREAWEALFAKY